MTGIPLVNSNSVNDINTSIIAIKKEISSTGNTDVNVTVNLPENSIPVDAVTDGDMHAVTSNAVANAIGFSSTEEECGNFFNIKKYHKSYIFNNVSITANSIITIQNNFEIPIGKIRGITGYAVSDDTSFWFNNLEFYIESTDNKLCCYPKLGNGTFTVVIDVQYIK